MHRLYGTLLLVLTICSAAHAEFSYPLSPGNYRLYYADDVRDQIRTCTLSFSLINDVPSIAGDEVLYAASNPSGLAAYGDTLVWVENGTSLYRGPKDAATAKSLLNGSLGGYAKDVIVRGGAIYITDCNLNGYFGVSKIDLSGTTMGQVRAPLGFPKGIEKVAMNYLVRTTSDQVYAFPFNGGPTQLLTTLTSGGLDITVADTSLVWGVASGGTVTIYKKSLGGGGTSIMLFSSFGEETRYMDTVDNRIFAGFTWGASSYLGTVGVRGGAGAHGEARLISLTPNTGLRGLVVEKFNMVKNDFDGDGIADRSVYYPATGQWYVYGTATGFYTDQFGYPGTIPVPGDYDGDGTTDYGIFDNTTGTWQLFRSSLGYYSYMTAASIGTIPAVSDYDNDGKSDLAVFRPSTGKWHIIGSKRGYFEDQFGNAFMIPVDTQTRAQ